MLRRLRLLATTVVAIALFITVVTPANAVDANNWNDTVSPYQGNKQWNFAPLNAREVWTAPVSGTYLLETWGARGGGFSNTWGVGGYSYGAKYITAGTVVNVFVGNSGTASAIGWNAWDVNSGGAPGISPYSDGNNGYGGGATDMRIGGTALANQQIVAGGGGGALSGRDGGNGGGTAGGPTTARNCQVIAGGTQSVAGNRGGRGVGGISGSTDPGRAGGGGGYYGGGAPATNGVSYCGSGGSGYVGGVPTTATTITATAGGTTTVSLESATLGGGTMESNAVTIPSPTGGTEQGHSSSGYARIKLLVPNNGNANNKVTFSGTSQAKTYSSNQVNVSIDKIVETTNLANIYNEDKSAVTGEIDSGRYIVYYAKSGASSCLEATTPSNLSCAKQSGSGMFVNTTGLTRIPGLEPNTEYVFRVYFAAGSMLNPPNRPAGSLLGYYYWYPVIRARTLPLDADGSVQLAECDECKL